MTTDSTVLISPCRLDYSDFVGPLPLVRHVLAQFLSLSNEAQESRPGKWSRKELYNTTADDLLALCADSGIADNVVLWVKPKIVKCVITLL